MPRILRNDLAIGVAELFAQRSTCLRLHVGAALFRDNRVIATGYNGSPKGEPHCTAETCNADNPCRNTVHAEVNLIAFCAKNGIETNGASLHITHIPCKDCSKLLIQAGISSVYFLHSYRDASGVFLLENAGVSVFTKEDTGWVPITFEELSFINRESID